MKKKTSTFLKYACLLIKIMYMTITIDIQYMERYLYLHIDEIEIYAIKKKYIKKFNKNWNYPNEDIFVKFNDKLQNKMIDGDFQIPTTYNMKSGLYFIFEFGHNKIVIIHSLSISCASNNTVNNLKYPIIKLIHKTTSCNVITLTQQIIHQSNDEWYSYIKNKNQKYFGIANKVYFSFSNVELKITELGVCIYIS